MGDPEGPVNRRYVVSIRMTGLGDRLACLAAAWRYARDTGRSLIVDWRFGRITSEAPENAFSLCFKATAKLASVPLFGERHIETASLPKPRFPATWNEDVFLALPFIRPAHTFAAEEKLAIHLIREGRDVQAQTVVFDGCINDGLVELEDARKFFTALRPTSSIAEQVASYRQFHMAKRKVVGLHVRHGNGGNIMAHAPYWTSFDLAINRCVKAVRRVRQLLGNETAVFLCTDSSQVQDELKRALPNLLTRPKAFRAPGEGDLHRKQDAWTGRDDALIEMLLLSECEALIRYPPGSFFSFYAAAMLAGNEPRLHTVYDLHQPWDDADRMSPAIIFRSSQPATIPA
jgi:hypothetical protein